MPDILYLDDHLVACHKPSGLLVHRSNLDRHETRFAVQLVRDQLGRRVFPLHRLDRGTSGLLLFALDAASARHIGRQFEERTVGKRYLAIVRGWPADSGLIDHPLTRQQDSAVPRGQRDALTARHSARPYHLPLPFLPSRHKQPSAGWPPPSCRLPSIATPRRATPCSNWPP